MSYSRAQLAEISDTVGRNWRTLQRWAAEGCRLEDPQSLKAFLTAKELRRTNIARSRERRGINPSSETRAGKEQTPIVTEHHRSMPDGNGEVPVRKQGAQFALKKIRARARAKLRSLRRIKRDFSRCGRKFNTETHRCTFLLRPLVGRVITVSGWEHLQADAARFRLRI